MNKGFVVLAQNTKATNYISCAEALAKSIKKVMPNSSITLISNDSSMCNSFDNVVELPYGDLAPESDWKLINDWQVYEASPYDYTIKLEADMLVPSNIEYFWDVLKEKDIVVCTKIRNFKNEITDDSFYRKFIYNNNLPSCYNGLTYFKKSNLAQRFFDTVKDVFENWDQYRNLFKCNPDEEVTTDWAYSIACHATGVENTTMAGFDKFSMVHMKHMINNLYTNDWTNELVYEFNDESFRVNTFVQTHPFHYHIKEFSEVIHGHI